MARNTEGDPRITRKTLLIGTAAGVGGLALGWLGSRFFSDRTTTTQSPKPPFGGVWQSPTEGATISNDVELVAHVYPTDATDPRKWRVSHVNFTTPDVSNIPELAGDPEQGSWRILRVTPDEQGIARQRVSLQAGGAQPGDVRWSFDVYGHDKDGTVGKNESPNGTRRVAYKP